MPDGQSGHRAKAQIPKIEDEDEYEDEDDLIIFISHNLTGGGGTKAVHGNNFRRFFLTGFTGFFLNSRSV